MWDKVLDQICKQSVQAATPKVIDLSDYEPEYVYGIFDGKEFKKCAAAVGPRGDELFSLEDFCKEVSDRKDTTTVIFIGQGKAIAVIKDEADRRDRISLELPLSKAMEALLACEAQRQARTQAAFVEQLRVTFNGCIDPATVDLFKSVKTATDKQVDSSVRTSMNRLDAKVVNQVMADGKDIPEEISLQVYAYRDLVGTEYLHTVRCAVVCDITAEGGPKFTLIPMAGELAAVQRATDSLIRDNIKTSTSIDRVYCGRPS